MKTFKTLSILFLLVISPISISDDSDQNYQARLQDVMHARKLMNKKRERDNLDA